MKKYEITKNICNKTYTLWKNINTDHGIGCYKILTGTRKICYARKKEMKVKEKNE